MATEEKPAQEFPLRIIELPAVRMARSGNTDHDKFLKWWLPIHENDAYHIFPRDFMWRHDVNGYSEWLYAVPSGLADFGGYETFDFAGGLYVVVTCKESDLFPASKFVKQWLNESEKFGAFADTTVEKFNMMHVITPKAVKEVLGYNEVDFFIPIVLRRGQQESKH